MEDDSPVIYGLELNVSSQFIGLLFLLKTSFDNNFKGPSSIVNLIKTGIVNNCLKIFQMSAGSDLDRFSHLVHVDDNNDDEIYRKNKPFLWCSRT